MINSKNKQSVVTIGNFDGLHKGHLALVKKVISLKEKHNLFGVMLTFDVNTKNSELIFEKKALKNAVKELGIDKIVSLSFADKVKKLSCEEFVSVYLKDELNAKYVVVGDNFFFGKNKVGNTDTLKELGEKYGFKTIVVPCLKSGKNIVSSTYIRLLIKDGKIKKANKLLYRPYSLVGNVQKGFGVGNSILNIPTANVALKKGLVKPKNGVYKTSVILDGKMYKGITNVGIAPTNPKKEAVSETFILDFDGNIYSKKITVIFEDFMRSERKFKDFESLKKKISSDISKRKEM